MKTLITFPLDCGILGQIEFTASANCEIIGDDVVATNINISAYIPSINGRGNHIAVTHSIADDELETITDRIIQAFWVRHDPTIKPYNSDHLS